MATRPVFIPLNKAPYYDVYMPEFTWNGGFAASQKRKNIVALHEAFCKRFPERKVLEISSKSLQDIGIELSAFNLMKHVPSLDRKISVECAFQGGKVFSGGGPYTDLYNVTSREAKKDSRLKSSGELRSFYFEGKNIPLVPKEAFYNWLYINAILENPQYSKQILEFDGFTDIEFNPGKSLNCQAKAAAVFVSLSKLGLLEKCTDFDSFAALFKRS